MLLAGCTSDAASYDPLDGLARRLASNEHAIGVTSGIPSQRLGCSATSPAASGKPISATAALVADREGTVLDGRRQRLPGGLRRNVRSTARTDLGSVLDRTRPG